MTADGPDDGSKEKGILAPEELDITNSPKVKAIDEGRYVVSADDIDIDTDQFGGTSQSSAELPPTDDDSTETPATGEASTGNEHATTPTTNTDDETDASPDDTDESGDDEETGSTGGPPAKSTGDEQPADAADPPAVELTQQRVSQFLAESLADADTSYGFDATVNIDGDVNRGRMSSDDIAETLEGLLRWYAKQTTDEVEPEAALGIILAGSTLEVEYPVQSAYAMLKQHDLQPDDSISDLLTAVRKEGAFTVPPSKNE